MTNIYNIFVLRGIKNIDLTNHMTTGNWFMIIVLAVLFNGVALVNEVLDVKVTDDTTVAA